MHRGRRGHGHNSNNNGPVAHGPVGREHPPARQDNDGEDRRALLVPDGGGGRGDRESVTHLRSQRLHAWDQVLALLPTGLVWGPALEGTWHRLWTTQAMGRPTGHRWGHARSEVLNATATNLGRPLAGRSQPQDPRRPRNVRRHDRQQRLWAGSPPPFVF